MTLEQRKRGIWGFGVWALYGAFVLFILSLAAWAATQRFDLVERDYYEKGLAYQTQIDGSRRALRDGEPRLEYNRSARSVSLCLPLSGTPISEGEILFYRSSDARHDFKLTMSTDSLGCQTIADSRLIPGPWRVKCQWRFARESRYWEGELYVP